MNNEKIFTQIQKDVEELKAIIILLNQEKLELIKKNLLPASSIKNQIYELCDGTHTISEMASALGKDNPYIRSYLSILRREGLIRKIEKNGEIYHEQIF